MSGSRPRFSTELGGNLERSSLVPFSVTCQAQGYPVPVFRWIISSHGVTSRLSLKKKKEPVSGSRPRFSTELKGGNLERSSLSPFSLTCQAQGYPVPVFRLVHFWLTIQQFFKLNQSRVAASNRVSLRRPQALRCCTLIPPPWVFFAPLKAFLFPSPGSRPFSPS